MLDLLFIFALILFCNNSYGLSLKEVENNSNYVKNKIDMNHDGIIDILANDFNSDYAYVFIREGNKYIYKGEVDKYTYDGLYSIEDISPEKNRNIAFSITTSFNGGGDKIRKYFYRIENGKIISIQNMSFDNVYRTLYGKITSYTRVCISSSEFTIASCYLDNSEETFDKNFITNFHYLDAESVEKLLKSHITVNKKDL